MSYEVVISIRTAAFLEIADPDFNGHELIKQAYDAMDDEPYEGDVWLNKFLLNYIDCDSIAYSVECTDAYYTSDCEDGLAIREFLKNKRVNVEQLKERVIRFSSLYPECSTKSKTKRPFFTKCKNRTTGLYGNIVAHGLDSVRGTHIMDTIRSIEDYSNVAYGIESFIYNQATSGLFYVDNEQDIKDLETALRLEREGKCWGDISDAIRR